jgi:hypothetical protein
MAMKQSVALVAVVVVALMVSMADARPFSPSYEPVPAPEYSPSYAPEGSPMYVPEGALAYAPSYAPEAYAPRAHVRALAVTRDSQTSRNNCHFTIMFQEKWTETKILYDKKLMYKQALICQADKP